MRVPFRTCPPPTPFQLAFMLKAVRNPDDHDVIYICITGAIHQFILFYEGVEQRKMQRLPMPSGPPRSTSVG